jgi:hypothetical protein
MSPILGVRPGCGTGGTQLVSKAKVRSGVRPTRRFRQKNGPETVM